MVSRVNKSREGYLTEIFSTCRVQLLDGVLLCYSLCNHRISQSCLTSFNCILLQRLSSLLTLDSIYFIVHTLTFSLYFNVQSNSYSNNLPLTKKVTICDRARPIQTACNPHALAHCVVKYIQTFPVLTGIKLLHQGVLN